MATYLLRKVLYAILVLVGVIAITFFIRPPGDPARVLLGQRADEASLRALREQLGLDKPLPVQMGYYMVNLAQGDMGRSYLQKTEVAELIWSRLPATLLLMLGAIVCELVLGLTMGIAAALWRGRAVDQVLMIVSFVAVSEPQFVVSL